MKKTKLIVFFMMLVISICFLIPLKVSATTNEGNAEDWYNFITQFEDGIATAKIETIYQDDSYAYWINILIKQSPDNEYDGYYIHYDVIMETNSYFEEDLVWVFLFWGALPEYRALPFDEVAEIYFGDENEYNGLIYWNFEEEYWQIEPYGISELDYYRQRVEYLENLVTDLKDEIQQLEDEIQQLEDDFEDALDDEYNRGFEAGKASIIEKNNEAFYQGLEKWLVPAIITVIALGGFLTIAARKRREE